MLPTTDFNPRANFDRPVSLDERWLVFAALSPAPRDVGELCDITDLPFVRVVRTLCVLGEDNLAILHSYDQNEWRLSDVAS